MKESGKMVIVKVSERSSSSTKANKDHDQRVDNRSKKNYCCEEKSIVLGERI